MDFTAQLKHLTHARWNLGGLQRAFHLNNHVFRAITDGPGHVLSKGQPPHWGLVTAPYTPK